MKTTILAFSISVLLICPILDVKAIQLNQTTCDNTQLGDCTTQSFIIEKQDKQIANLTDQVIGLKNAESENANWKNIGITFGIIGSIVSIMSTIYGIKKNHLVCKTKQRKPKQNLIRLGQKQKKLGNLNILLEP